MGGVPFSLLAWIPWEARIAQRFHRKAQQMAKMTQNHHKKGVPPFLHVFILHLYNFFPGTGRSPKMAFFNPIGTGLKKHHFGACSGSPKKNIEVHDGGARIAPGGLPLF